MSIFFLAFLIQCKITDLPISAFLSDLYGTDFQRIYKTKPKNESETKEPEYGHIEI